MVQQLFHTPAAGNEGTDPEFMRILQGYIFGDVCRTGSLDLKLRELVTITALTALGALPQLKAHVEAGLNAGCTPVEIREAVYQCAPFIGFPLTLNAISAMNEAFTARGIDLPLPEQVHAARPAHVTAPLPEQGTLASSGERYERGLELQAPIYGTEIKERYGYLPGGFAEAVPRFLTELCFGDFSTRTGLGKTNNYYLI